MGYYATYDGVIDFNDNFKKDLSKNKTFVEEILSNAFDDTFTIHKNDNGSYGISIGGEVNYHDDEIYKAYKEISPFVDYASIAFFGCGEDFWKHTFEYGTWREYSGSVIYDPNYTTIVKGDSND